MRKEPQAAAFPYPTFGESGLTKREYATIHILAAVVGASIGLKPSVAVKYANEYADELFGKEK